MQADPAILILGGVEFTSLTPLQRRGVVVRVHASQGTGGTPSLAIAETKTWNAVDPVRLRLESDTLWIIDYLSRRLLAADMSSRQAPDLIPSESELSVVGDASSIAVLARPAAPYLMGFGLTDPTARLALAAPSLDAGQVWALSRTNNTWAVTVNSVNESVHIRDWAFLSGQAPFEFRLQAGAASGNWKLFDPAGSVIANGTTSPGQWTQVGPVAAMHADPAGEFKLDFQSDQTNVYLRPGVRYMPSGSTTQDFQIGRALFSPRIPIGESEFGHGIEVTTSMAGATQGYLAVALRNQDGSDPLFWAGGVPILDTGVSLGFSFVTEQIRNAVGILFPIPEDPNLSGLVVLWQYWFLLPGNHMAVSEVFGGRVLGGEGEGGTAMASGTAGMGSGTGGPARRTAAMDALRVAMGARLQTVAETKRVRHTIGSRFRR